MAIYKSPKKKFPGKTTETTFITPKNNIINLTRPPRINDYNRNLFIYFFFFSFYFIYIFFFLIRLGLFEPALTNPLEKWAGNPLRKTVSVTSTSRIFVLNGTLSEDRKSREIRWFLKPDTTEPRGATGRSERALWDRWILSAQVSSGNWDAGYRDVGLGLIFWV